MSGSTVCLELSCSSRLSTSSSESHWRYPRSSFSVSFCSLSIIPLTSTSKGTLSHWVNVPCIGTSHPFFHNQVLPTGRRGQARTGFQEFHPTVFSVRLWAGPPGRSNSVCRAPARVRRGSLYPYRGSPHTARPGFADRSQTGPLWFFHSLRPSPPCSPEAASEWRQPQRGWPGPAGPDDFHPFR